MEYADRIGVAVKVLLGGVAEGGVLGTVAVEGNAISF